MKKKKDRLLFWCCSLTYSTYLPYPPNLPATFLVRKSLLPHPPPLLSPHLLVGFRGGAAGGEGGSCSLTLKPQAP